MNLEEVQKEFSGCYIKTQGYMKEEYGVDTQLLYKSEVNKPRNIVVLTPWSEVFVIPGTLKEKLKKYLKDKRTRLDQGITYNSEKEFFRIPVTYLNKFVPNSNNTIIPADQMVSSDDEMIDIADDSLADVQPVTDSKLEELVTKLEELASGVVENPVDVLLTDAKDTAAQFDVHLMSEVFPLKMQQSMYRNNIKEYMDDITEDPTDYSRFVHLITNIILLKQTYDVKA